MASVTCPNCGKDNPDFLDNCQYCQTALRREATLNIGEGPTKKTTGELEGVLPDWLKDARQQAREGAKEEAEKEATKPKIQKAEPVDLLAGLAFQAADDEEEVPDWLAAINPVADKKAPTTSKPAESESSDFFAQFNQPAKEEPKREDDTSAWMQESPASSQNDELGGWMDQTSAAPSAGSFDFGAGAQDDNNWLNNLSEPASPQQPAEDLGWLHDLEASSTPTPPAPSTDMGWMSNTGSTGGQEDLSWLNNLGGMPANEPPPSQPASSQEDLGWLNNLGGMPVNEPAPSHPAASDDLDWLSNLGGTPVSEPASSQPTSSSGDLDWLNNLGGTPVNEPTPSQPTSSQEDLSWLSSLGGTPVSEPPVPSQPASSSEDLGWLNNLGGTPVSEPEPSQPAAPSSDLDWLNNLGGTPISEPAPSQPASSDDMGWLSNLGGIPASEPEPSQTAATSSDLDWLNNLSGTPVSEPASSQPASSDDMSWLSNLGGTPASEPEPSQSTASSEDLGWLGNLGGIPPVDEPASAQPVSSSDDLGWLNNLGTIPANEPVPSQPALSQEDMGWLNSFGGTSDSEPPVPSQPVSSSEDLDWLSNLGGTPTTSGTDASASFAEQPVSPDWLTPAESQSRFNPPHTAPLSDEAANNMPDWLRSATEASSMPPLNSAASKDWFAAREHPADELKFEPEVNQNQPADIDQLFKESESLTRGTPESASQNLFTPTSDSAPISNQDIDSLFAVDMPDWLTQSESGSTPDQTSQVPGGISAGVDDSLSPVNLPSWVQAMRPVEAAISNAPIPIADQPAEREGPLAGIAGVIPLIPVGSAQRPKPLSLKLQASTEQQDTAALLEQIIASETAAQPFRVPLFVASQRTLRWVLTGLFFLVIGVVLGFGTQTAQIAIPNNKMAEISNMANTIQSLPVNAPVLIVMDYEPALAGEMEAVSGPLLDQIVIARQPNLTFVASSPNNSALVERLLASAKINTPIQDGGQGYQLDTQYFNAGYISGGFTGVRGFIEQPQVILPSVKVSLFSDFAAVVVITDQAESGQAWIEQIAIAKQSDPALANQPLLVVSSAQAGPLLQPYVASKQIAGMISGLADASRYEFMNNSRPGIARTYWDAFGAGLFLAIISIVLGSLWNIISGFRTQRAKAENG